MPLVACRAYRGLYIINWIYRSFTEDDYRQWIGLSITTLWLSVAFSLSCMQKMVAVKVQMTFWAVQYYRNWAHLLCMQCGFLGLYRQLFMQTFSTITSEVGKITRSYLCLLSLHCCLICVLAVDTLSASHSALHLSMLPCLPAWLHDQRLIPQRCSCILWLSSSCRSEYSRWQYELLWQSSPCDLCLNWDFHRQLTVTHWWCHFLCLVCQVKRSKTFRVNLFTGVASCCVAYISVNPSLLWWGQTKTYFIMWACCQ